MILLWFVVCGIRCYNAETHINVPTTSLEDADVNRVKVNKDVPTKKGRAHFASYPHRNLPTLHLY